MFERGQATSGRHAGSTERWRAGPGSRLDHAAGSRALRV